MPKKMLIIDDEAGIVEEVVSYFEEEGYEVKTADCGKDGKPLIESFKPDLLLLDIKLPDISGLDLLKYSKEVSPATKVIVLTGYVDQTIIDKAEQLGRDAFLQKPFDLMTLVDEMERVMGE